MVIDVNLIKPDPNQPRRNFDPEEMALLESSMKNNGFRIQYPITVDANHVIVDGERRWRTATKLGITQVPIQITESVNEYERLLYQLCSEGAKITVEDKYNAWMRLYDTGNKIGETYASCAEKLGVSEGTFRHGVEEYRGFKELIPTVSETTTISFEKNFPAISNITWETDEELKKSLAMKAIKEEWNSTKAREVRKAIKENPTQKEQILKEDYSDDYPNSNRWKLRLDVAKTDITEPRFNVDGTIDHRQNKGQAPAEELILKHLWSAHGITRNFDYKEITDAARLARIDIRVSQALKEMQDWLKEYETFIKEKGILNS